MRRIIGIWINCSSVEEAEEVGRALMAAKLAPGFNRHPPIASAYVWQGEVHEREEVPLLVKTREELFDRIVAEVKAHHGYEVPAITSVAIPQASADYVGWIYENTSGADQEERSTRVPVK